MLIGLFCLALAVFCLSAGILQGPVVRDSLFEWEKTTASSLLEQGVDASLVAEAFHAKEITPEGERLVEQIGHTQENTSALFPEARMAMLRMGAACFVIGILLSAILYLMTFLFLKKREMIYEQAAETVEKYAQGDFSERLTRGGTGGLNHLFSKVDQLATALRAKSEAESEAKNFLKDTISDISHQLKTPLAALNMYTEIISAEPDQPETVKRFADKSVSALGRMERLIRLLLKVMRLDAGSVTFVPHIVSVSELAEAAARDLYVRADKEGKQIFFEGSRDALLACDEEWTAEALSNLIKNSLDHTEEGGWVKVSWACSPAMLRISVKDNGNGILPEDIHHIFKRFYRSRNSEDSQGVGLGLPLARSIIEGQSGVLSVASTPGEGAEFTISFPAARHCQRCEKGGQYPYVPYRDCVGSPPRCRQPEELHPYGRIFCVQHHPVLKLQSCDRLYEPRAETAAAVGSGSLH